MRRTKARAPICPYRPSGSGTRVRHHRYTPRRYDVLIKKKFSPWANRFRTRYADRCCAKRREDIPPFPFGRFPAVGFPSESSIDVDRGVSNFAHSASSPVTRVVSWNVARAGALNSSRTYCSASPSSLTPLPDQNTKTRIRSAASLAASTAPGTGAHFVIGSMGVVCFLSPSQLLVDFA